MSLRRDPIKVNWGGLVLLLAVLVGLAQKFPIQP
tara:strand:- start:4567 stop:4668 length:102 start_codon:yes stop_codon:yes gene_type:complete